MQVNSKLKQNFVSIRHFTHNKLLLRATTAKRGAGHGPPGPPLV